eukprot:c4146_g1_i1.p1 GENE.c4146_g1_i1~~c4146_g1_i1.p1  ORF type:complete len:252 (+),score=34.07 c4146_g1_i1:44-799(+)
MSSFTNAYKAREHWGRSQLSFRKKLGSLEKHSQYKVRAKNYHRKQATLKNLRKKAENKNPNEFNLGMIGATQKNGAVILADHNESNREIPAERLKLMKSQDVNYLTLKSQTETQKVETLKSQLHFIGLPPKNKHTIFVDDKESASNFDAAKHFQTHPDLVGRTFNRPTLDQLKQENIIPVPGGRMKNKIEKARLSKYKELEQRVERIGKLSDARSEMQLHRQLMAKGKRKLITKRKGRKLPVYKWVMERKR